MKQTPSYLKLLGIQWVSTCSHFGGYNEGPLQCEGRAFGSGKCQDRARDDGTWTTWSLIFKKNINYKNSSFGSHEKEFAVEICKLINKLNWLVFVQFSVEMMRH